ncbi:hypothetical protein A9P82_04475 [Arachidicoccus ginsenosidimutans]|uniref:DUF4199 domain-containing protein n=1 Tax=Arachidicoccus sp. BS20 TaxID=1850526 RepID=UPI0007F09CE4|nr:DUF4199 domain-containing protein [Arachidicoccus sp. BS20]ANI88606.1 hypothetical protein A9P82_04475 [Arachidicoccus sp. BS20]
MEKKVPSFWINAIVISLISIVYGLVLHFTNLETNKALGGIGLLIFIVAIVIVCIQYSKSLNGNVTFGNLFAYGFKTSAAIALIMIVWTVLMFKVIFPNLEDEQLQKQTQAMIQKGMQQDQIDKGMEVAHKYFMVFAIGGSILFYAFFGAVSSVIGAAIAKKNPKANNPFGQ